MQTAKLKILYASNNAFQLLTALQKTTLFFSTAKQSYIFWKMTNCANSGT